MSDHFRRMALVPEALLTTIQQYQKQQVTPQTKGLVRLDNQMDTILNDSSLPEDQKAQLYSQTLQRYLTMYNKNLPTPMQTSTISTESVNPSTSNTPSQPSNNPPSNIEKEIMNSVPKTFKSQAQGVINKLKANSQQISWNDKGELISNGAVVPGTNVVDLVTDVVRPRKNFEPRGYEAFAQQLAKINMPEDLMRNDARRRLVLQYRNNPTKSATPSPQMTRRDNETPAARSFFPSPPSSRAPPVKRRILPRKEPKITQQGQWIDY